jgi:hypothetical protein
VLETADRHWVAERVPPNSVRAISNRFSISRPDLASAGVVQFAIGSFVWVHCFGSV